MHAMSANRALPERVPLAFEIGHCCLDVSVENWINRNLFIGRAVHFTVQFIEPLLAELGLTELVPRTNCAVRSFAAAATRAVPTGDANLATAADLVRVWHQVERALLGQEPNEPWASAAASTLHQFLIIDLAIDKDFHNADRLSEFAAGPEPVLTLAASAPAAYLDWVDSAGTGGPSAELMCFMNPYWRRSGFIYGSPFDAINRLTSQRIRGTYSHVAGLSRRGLRPPIRAHR